MNSAIERLVSLKVADVMSRQVVSVSHNATMAEAARMMCEKEVRGMPVIDEQGRCVGIITTTDFTSRDQNLAESGGMLVLDDEFAMYDRGSWSPVRIAYIAEDRVRQHMTEAIQTVSEASSLLTAARMMCDEHIRRLVVLDESSRPVGVIGSLDVVAAMVNVIEE